MTDDQTAHIKMTGAQRRFMEPGSRVLSCGFRSNAHAKRIEAIRRALIFALRNPDKLGCYLVPSVNEKIFIEDSYGHLLPDNLLVLVPGELALVEDRP